MQPSSSKLCCSALEALHLGRKRELAIALGRGVLPPAADAVFAEVCADGIDLPGFGEVRAVAAGTALDGIVSRRTRIGSETASPKTTACCGGKLESAPSIVRPVSGSASPTKRWSTSLPSRSAKTVPHCESA